MREITHPTKPSTPRTRINCPDDATAAAIARAAVEARLAACANMEPPIRSVYRSQGKILEATETVLLLKTAARHFDAIAALVADHHPDAVPAIFALPAAQTTDAIGAPDVTHPTITSASQGTRLNSKIASL